VCFKRVILWGVWELRRIRATWQGIARWIRYIVKMYFGELYDDKYWDSPFRKELGTTSVAPIVSGLIDRYDPKSIIDIGCGDGIYLEEFSKRGIDVMGYDNSKAAVKLCKHKGINAQRMNFVKDEMNLNREFDLAICFEVAEHLPTSASDRLIKLLSACADTVAFTAAPPGQGGIHHINEQPYEYWIEKFNNEGYFFDSEGTWDLRDKWRQAVVMEHMINNFMVFKKSEIKHIRD